MSDLARERIAQNKRTKATYVDLGNCGLTVLPDEFRDLVWLQFMSLASSWWSWTGEQWEERNSRNTGAPNASLCDLAPLAGLTALQSLTVSGNQLEEIERITV